MFVQPGHVGPVYAVAFDPSGDRLATAGKDGAVVLRDGFGAEIERIGGEWPAVAVAFDDAGKLGYAAGATLHLPGGPAVPFAVPVAGFAALPGGLWAVACGDRGRPGPGHLILVDVAGRYRPPSVAEPAGAKAVAVLGERVAWANGARRVSLWDIRRPGPQHIALSHTAAAVALHPDGRTLAATADRTVKVFEIAQASGPPRERFTLAGHTGLVTAVAASPDGRYFLSASWDGTVRRYAADTGAAAGVFEWKVGRVTCLGVSPDGTRLAAGGDSGAVVVWDCD